MLTSLRELQEPNSPDLIGELSGMFREDGQRRLARLREALEAADRDQLRLTAHSLKGSAGNLGASRLARVCAVIESTAADAALPVLDALVARASRVFDLSVEALGRV
jgi:HPt (histidine-containing phosphotransfer) domain-containing protein